MCPQTTGAWRSWPRTCRVSEVLNSRWMSRCGGDRWQVERRGGGLHRSTRIRQGARSACTVTVDLDALNCVRPLFRGVVGGAACPMRDVVLDRGVKRQTWLSCSVRIRGRHKIFAFFHSIKKKIGQRGDLALVGHAPMGGFTGGGVKGGFFSFLFFFLRFFLMRKETDAHISPLATKLQTTTHTCNLACRWSLKTSVDNEIGPSPPPFDLCSNRDATNARAAVHASIVDHRSRQACSALLRNTGQARAVARRRKKVEVSADQRPPTSPASTTSFLLLGPTSSW